jgi:septum formation protein
VKHHYRFILASQSPRRQEFIRYLQIPFDIRVGHTKEESLFTDPSSIVEDLAWQKAKAIKDLCNSEDHQQDYFPFICAADTLVFYQQKALGKPQDEQEAKEMLRLLSGSQHQVYTGVCLMKKSFLSGAWSEKRFHCVTHVTFAHIKEDDLQLYLFTKDYQDKAGAYGVQGEAQVFIQDIQGSYSNVVGLPLWEVKYEMEAWCQEDKETSSGQSWRELFKSAGD